MIRCWHNCSEEYFRGSLDYFSQRCSKDFLNLGSILGKRNGNCSTRIQIHLEAHVQFVAKSAI